MKSQFCYSDLDSALALPKAILTFSRLLREPFVELGRGTIVLLLTLMPDAVDLRTVRKSTYTLAMLVAFAPLSFISFAVWPDVDSLALFVIVFILADILAAVRPRKEPSTIHFVVDPCSFVHPLVGPNVGAFSTDLIIIELTDIAAPISPVKLALTMLLTIHELPFEQGTVRPLLATKAALIISVELTYVSAAICMHVDSLSTGLTFSPDALVAVAIGMDESTGTPCLPLTPITFIPRAVRPSLDSAAHPNARWI